MPKIVHIILWQLNRVANRASTKKEKHAKKGKQIRKSAWIPTYGLAMLLVKRYCYCVSAMYCIEDVSRESRSYPPKKSYLYVYVNNIGKEHHERRKKMKIMGQ